MFEHIFVLGSVHFQPLSRLSTKSVIRSRATRFRGSSGDNCRLLKHLQIIIFKISPQNLNSSDNPSDMT